MTFPWGSTKKSEGNHWNLRDVNHGNQPGFGPLSIVWPKAIGYKNGLTRSRTMPPEPGCQSFSELGTLSRGTTAASNLSFNELGMSLSDFQMRSAGPTWGHGISAMGTTSSTKSYLDPSFRITQIRVPLKFLEDILDLGALRSGRRKRPQGRR